MTGTNHGLTGAIIALKVKNPALAVPLSLVSHFLQDLVPHWDYGVSRVGGKPIFFNRKFNLTLLADFSLAIILMIILAFMFPTQKWRLWACMIAAASPDLMWAYYRLYIGHIKRRPVHLDPVARFHHFSQWSQTAAGGLAEIVWFIAAGAIIMSLR